MIIFIRDQTQWSSEQSEQSVGVMTNFLHDRFSSCQSDCIATKNWSVIPQKNNEVQQFYFKQMPENKFYQYYYYN